MDFPSGCRIVFVLGSLELGGAERQAILLADRLRQRNAEPIVVGFSHPDGSAAQLCQERNIPCRFIPFELLPRRGRPLRWLWQWARLAAALRRLKPDVLMPYYALPNLACGLVGRAAGARLCVWNQRDEGLRAHERLEAWAAATVSCFIANSPGAVRFLVNKMHVPQCQVHLIPNGVELPDVHRYHGQWRRRLGLSPERFVACMVANLTRNKDHAGALRAWRRVVDESPADQAPVLLLAGREDETAPQVRSLIEQWQLSECVRLLGTVADVAELLADCDLALLTSPSEGCPNAVLEAMAVGLPVAGFDIEGMRFALGPGGAQFLAPLGDDALLAQCVRQLIEDTSQRAEAGKANRRRAAAHFSPERLCDAVVDLLAAYLGEHRVRRAA